MKKQWEKIANGQYRLYIDDIASAEMQLDSCSLDKKAVATVGTQKINIRKSGFWKKTIKLLDEQGKVLAKAYHRKWYSTGYVLEVGNKAYKVIIRNNPLAEWVIFDKKEALLAYSLKQEGGSLKTNISTADDAQNPLFDILLWYLFLPIATENVDDTLLLLLLVS